MGCWSKTCGLSNLHITAGTEVYVFVLERNKTYNHCYSTSLFKPLLLPFESVYDDYGGGEDSSGIALPFVMAGLKDRLVEMALGKNKYHDIAVTKEGFTDKMFFEACHEDRMFVQSRYDKEKTAVYFTMMRKDIVDQILENRVLHNYVGSSKGTTGWGNSYIEYKFSDVVSSIRPLLNRLKEDTEVEQGFIMDRIHAYCDEYLAAIWLTDSGHRHSSIVDMKSLIGRAIEIDTVDAINKIDLLIAEYLKGIFIEEFMTSARKTWVPGGHEGSQSDSGDALRLLAQATISVLDKEKSEE